LSRSKKGFQAGSHARLLQAIPGTRARVLDSTALRRELPGLEGWVNRIAEGRTGRTPSFLWSLLVLATWCDAHGIT
jgi:hypothetical protein